GRHIHHHLARTASRAARHADHQPPRSGHPRRAPDPQAAGGGGRSNRHPGDDVPVALVRSPGDRWRGGRGLHLRTDRLSGESGAALPGDDLMSSSTASPLVERAQGTHQLSPAQLVEVYRAMLLIRTLDERMMTLQRQGRVGFYGACTGQEAAAIGSAFALRPTDWIFPALREGSAM